MVTMLNAIIIFILAFLPTPAGTEEPEILRRERGIFINQKCETNSSCSLKVFSITVEDYRVKTGGEWNFGTRLFAEYETDSIKTLEHYGLVQFIRGCKFESFALDGTTIKIGNIVTMHFGEIRPFRFPRWVIDSIDSDPMYQSAWEENRHSFYRWNTDHGSFTRDAERYYGEYLPPFPRLYVTDRPGVAFFMDGRARNISLQFKICIYKTADIPAAARGSEINFATPVHCFEWQSSFVYDHDAGMFTRKEALDPFCTEE